MNRYMEQHRSHVDNTVTVQYFQYPFLSYLCRNISIQKWLYLLRLEKKYRRLTCYH
jgi:hypothetical protein